MERELGRLCSRIELRYQWSDTSARMNDESGPFELEDSWTHPGGGHCAGSPPVECNEIASEARCDRPPSL